MNNRTFTVAAAVLLLALGGAFLSTTRGSPVVINTNLEQLPMEIDGYRAVEDRFPQAVYDELNADKHVYRHYSDAEGRQVTLYIGYYGTAKGGRTGHNPYACLPGAGWAILDSGKESLQQPGVDGGGPQQVRVNYILAGKDGRYETVLHWYQTDRDKVLATGFEQNIQRFLGRVLRNRNDGAFVRITTSCDEAGIAEAKRLTRGFAEKILALLPAYWPEEG